MPGPEDGLTAWAERRTTVRDGSSGRCIGGRGLIGLRMVVEQDDLTFASETQGAPLPVRVLSGGAQALLVRLRRCSRDRLRCVRAPSPA